MFSVECASSTGSSCDGGWEEQQAPCLVVPEFPQVLASLNEYSVHIVHTNTPHSYVNN